MHIGYDDVMLDIGDKGPDESQVFNVLMNKNWLWMLNPMRFAYFSKRAPMGVPVFTWVYLKKTEDIVHGFKGELVDQELLASNGEYKAVLVV